MIDMERTPHILMDGKLTIKTLFTLLTTPME
jgi:hypothetical protein